MSPANDFSGGGITSTVPHPDRFALRPPHKGEVIQSPSTAFAIMPRWISFDPPKIETLRMLK
jgi:hypothetical protein